MKKCKLCLNREADKPNSHIISKFLGKRLFESLPNRHSIQYSRITKNFIKKQDTPKEDFILCKSCEKRLEIIETYFSRSLNELFEFQKYPLKFQLDKIETQEFLRCNLRPDLFTIFIYSLIWRSSISELEMFKDYKLPENVEEQLRLLLDTNLKLSQKEMLNHSFLSITEFDAITCLIKPKEYNIENVGMLIAYQNSPECYLLFISEFIIMFYPKSELSEIAHRHFKISEHSTILIPLANTEQWNYLKKIIFDKLTQ
ncbi:hypothetical protein [Peijinzhouia sedimentorum]